MSIDCDGSVPVFVFIFIFILEEIHSLEVLATAAVSRRRKHQRLFLVSFTNSDTDNTLELSRSHHQNHCCCVCCRNSLIYRTSSIVYSVQCRNCLETCTVCRQPSVSSNITDEVNIMNKILERVNMPRINNFIHFIHFIHFIRVIEKLFLILLVFYFMLQ